MRETIAILLLLLAPVAAAQEPEPTVNDSDYNTSVPPDDQSYLDQAEAEYSAEPGVNDSDFDTSLPADDTSYLSEDVPQENAPTSSAGAQGGAQTPGPGVLALLAALGLLAFAARRRSG